MKRILITLLLVMPLLSFAQKTKTVNVAQMGYLNTTAEISYQDDGKTPKDTTYFIVGVDNQFSKSQTIDQYKHILIASGSLQKMYDILQSAQNMFNEEIGVNNTKYDVKMSLRKPFNLKEVLLHSSNTSDNGYTILTKEDTREIIYRMENYAQRNKIVLKKWK